MDLDLCFMDISKLKVSDSVDFKDYIIYSKYQKDKYFKKCLSDIILTTLCIYQDTTNNKGLFYKSFQFQINENKLEEDLVVLGIIENWNYAILIATLKCSVFSITCFKTYLINLTNLLKFLFGTLETSFLKHKQETSILIDKAFENYNILSLNKPFEYLKNYPNVLEDLLMEFASMFNRHEKEYILISDVYLMKENSIIYARDSDEHLLELFLYHSVIKNEDDCTHPKYYFHKVHSLKSTNQEQRYSLLISNCFLTIIVLFNCQLKDLKSPPVSLIRRSRVFIGKLYKYIKENVHPVKLQNYRDLNELIFQMGRKENKLLNWFRSRSFSFNAYDNKSLDEKKTIIRIFGDSIFDSSTQTYIYGLKYQNNVGNFRLDFPVKNDHGTVSSMSTKAIHELNIFFSEVNENMKILSENMNMKDFEVSYLVDLNIEDDLISKKPFIKITGIFDDVNKDWLLICIKEDSCIDVNVCLHNLRQFLQL